METFSATTIFWLMVLGALTGWCIGNLMGREGITVGSNIAWGVVGTLLSGLIALWVQLSGVLLFGFMGALATLFLANVFHLHHVEDISGDIRREIKIRGKNKKPAS